MQQRIVGARRPLYLFSKLTRCAVCGGGFTLSSRDMLRCFSGTMATMIEIAQRYGFGYGISPDEVRDLVGSGYLAVRQIDCRMLDARYEAAMRLSRTLAGLAWLYAAGAGMSVGAPPVAAALGFGALVTGIASTAAGWIAADIRAHRSQVKCTNEGGIEWFSPAARKILAAVDPAIFRYSWQHWCGVSESASCRG